MANKKLIWGAGIVVVAVAVAGGIIGTTVASGTSDNEEPIRGAALEQASAAALAHTGGGRVTDTEAGDEDAYYEVEVTLDDGTQVDVHLDQEFNVVGDESDGAGEDEGADDDD